MPKSTEHLTSKSDHDEVCEYIDVFDAGSLTDLHLESDITEDELVKRFQDAAHNVAHFGGNLSPGIQSDLDNLSAPRMSWEDFVSFHIGSKKEGEGKNDWSRPRSRALMAGLFLPRKKRIVFKLLVLVDRSASVTKEKATYGLSQIQALSHSVEGYVVCFDTVAYWESKGYIESATPDQLLQLEFTGGGGTVLAPALYSYEEELEPVDMLIVITDGGIFDLEKINSIGSPNLNTQVVWILTESNANFKPSFGRVFNLDNDHV